MSEILGDDEESSGDEEVQLSPLDIRARRHRARTQAEVCALLFQSIYGKILQLRRENLDASFSNGRAHRLDEVNDRPTNPLHRRRPIFRKSHSLTYNIDSQR